jgi:hypothetical protein
MRFFRIGVAAALATITAGTASAQEPAPRAFIALNGGSFFSSNEFSDIATFEANAEEGTFETDYVLAGGPAFDVAAGRLFGRYVGAGVSVTRSVRSSTTTVTAAIPHPFLFNRLRPASGEVAGARREELAIHLQARVVLPVAKRFEATLFGGPSYFRINQDLVGGITFADEYPYDAATFGTGVLAAARDSGVGVNAGADVSFFLTRWVGVGVNVQYSRAMLALVSGGRAVSVRAGGAQTGAGLRLRF